MSSDTMPPVAEVKESPRPSLHAAGPPRIGHCKAERRRSAFLADPPLITRARARLHSRVLGTGRPKQELHKTLLELSAHCAELRNRGQALEEPWVWAQCEQAAGHLTDFHPEELVALRLCACPRSTTDLLSPMGQALLEFDEIRRTRGGLSGSKAQVALLWEDLAVDFTAGLTRLRSSQTPPSKVFSVVRMSIGLWKASIEGRVGAAMCFCGALRAFDSEEELRHELADAAGPNSGGQDVLCMLEFDAVASLRAADVQSVSPTLNQSGRPQLILPPFTRGFLESIDDAGGELKRLQISGLRAVEPLLEVLEAPEEAVLAGSLLVGLHASQPPQEADGNPGADSAMLASAAGCFRALASAASVRDPTAVQTVWKGYFECMFEGMQSWKHFKDGKSGIIGVARVAVQDVAVAARGVTKRALGFVSAMNHKAMEVERKHLLQEMEEVKRSAVEVAREQVNALSLETLSDPEAFLRSLAHDPVRAFEAAPAAARAFVAASAAQRVLLFAKLMGLVAMAGGLLRGDPKVLAAFDSPFPLHEDSLYCEDQTLAEDLLENDNLEVPFLTTCKEVAARRASGLLHMQRLQLARTRLLIAGGAPDVGKTTILREAFGFEHFQAGLSPQGQTEQVAFALHPDGDERLRPVYAVDTPGFGDAGHLHRNDMVRLLLGAGTWIPGGVTLLWVIKAGRNVRQEADELLRSMATGRMTTLVVVTHVDNFFEERYREVGPQWRESFLEGVDRRDPRWVQQRRILMAELQAEVEAGVSAVVGDNHQGIVYACLGGWMAGERDGEQDEFSHRAPWPWARRELTNFFGILSRTELRRWLDRRVGLEPLRTNQ